MIARALVYSVGSITENPPTSGSLFPIVSPVWCSSANAKDPIVFHTAFLNPSTPPLLLHADLK